MQNVTIHGPNLPAGIQRQGEFIVHATGCRDSYILSRRLRSGPDWVIDAYSIADIVYEIYADHIDEGLDFDSALQDIHFCPCVTI